MHACPKIQQCIIWNKDDDMAQLHYCYHDYCYHCYQKGNRHTLVTSHVSVLLKQVFTVKEGVYKSLDMQRLESHNNNSSMRLWQHDLGMRKKS